MRGLPPVVMSIAVGIAWAAVAIPFVTYAAAAAVTLGLAWFLVKLIGVR